MISNKPAISPKPKKGNRPNNLDTCCLIFLSLVNEMENNNHVNYTEQDMNIS